MPVAPALTQAAEEIERAVRPLAPDVLWTCPEGVASVGFHVRHIGGSVDRLFAYAEGRTLDSAQRHALLTEGDPGAPPATASQLLDETLATIARAVDRLRAFPEAALAEPRTVGRAALPSTAIGLLFHAAEHAQRHVGQLLVTAKVAGAAG